MLASFKRQCNARALKCFVRKHLYYIRIYGAMCSLMAYNCLQLPSVYELDFGDASITGL